MDAIDSKSALVTNAAGFAGPPAVSALLSAGFKVFVHDASFESRDDWESFRGDRAGLEPIHEAEPEAIIGRVLERTDNLTTIISNDHFPAPAHKPDMAPTAALRKNYERLLEFPFCLIQAALPHLRTQAAANIVMITSNRSRLPLSGGAFPDAARAAANALVRSLAIDCADDDIIVNAIAPNFLYSEAYYPEAFFVETAEGRDYVRQNVPVGRLADPEEIGELIAFLATVKTRFLTGAIIDFSGGWPFGLPRPNG